MQGVIERLHHNGKAWSAVVQDEWYGVGFDKPGFEEGDTVEFDVEQRGKWKNMKNARKVQGAAPQAAASGGTPRRDISIQYQSSRKDAIQLVSTLLQAGAVSLPTKKADQMDAVLDLVDHISSVLYAKLEEVIEQGGVQVDVPGSEPDFE